MAELSPSIFFIAAGCLIAGLLIGWLLRGTRVKREKDRIHASWQEQLGAQKSEHDRIAEQNRSLMEQVSQYRASRQDADGRAKELSDSLREALEKREAMQAELREIRSNLEVTVKQRDRLKEEITAGGSSRPREDSLRDKDEKIFRLSRELESWQSRLPPLLEKFRERSLEAEQLEIELDKANARIAELEDGLPAPGETRVEPVDDAALATDLDASNEQYDDDGPVARPDVAGEEVPPESSNERSSEQTGIDTYLQAGEVDFDLGAAPTEGPSADAASAEGTLTEFFEDGGSVDEVDELLDAGDTAIRSVDEGSVESADSGSDRHSDSQSGSDVHSGDDAWHRPGYPSTGPARDNGDDGAAGRVEMGPASGNGHPQDDLQQIKGVGPAIEKTLNDLGIYSYDQIAEMSEVDIDRVARELRGFRSRIYREDWIGQARMLKHERSSTTH